MESEAVDGSKRRAYIKGRCTYRRMRRRFRFWRRASVVWLDDSWAISKKDDWSGMDEEWDGCGEGMFGADEVVWT